MFMKANEYKGLRKESLRDNMTDIELALTNIGELTTRDIVRKEHRKGLKENMKLVREVDLVLDLKGFLCLLLEWIV